MTLNALWRLIRLLFVALGAPASMIARAWRRDERFMRGFAHLSQIVRGRGWSLRYDGEDEATVAARIAAPMDRARSGPCDAPSRSPHAWPPAGPGRVRGAAPPRRGPRGRMRAGRPHVTCGSGRAVAVRHHGR